MPVTRRYEEAVKWVRLAASGTAINRAGSGKLHRVTVGNPVADVTCTIYNSPTTAGFPDDRVIAAIDCGNAGTFEYGLIAPSGLAVHHTGVASVTIIYE